MKKQATSRNNNRSPIRAFAVIGLLLSMVGIMAFGLNDNNGPNVGLAPAVPTVTRDSIASVKAFKQVYTVLMSPRCMNCHPSGNIPLQGDDSHLHTMSPQRGIDGKGVYAMKCANCHQPTIRRGCMPHPGTQIGIYLLPI